MTVIAGLVDDNGNIYIGGDSAGVSGYSLTVRNDEKVFRNGEFLIGYTSSFRMGQLLRYKFKPPFHMPSKSIYEYMVCDFIESVRECFKEGGYNEKRLEVDEGGSFLVGYRGNLFKVENDYQIGKSKYPFTSTGCGHELALGSLHTSVSFELTPKERINLALEVTEKCCAGVRSPFTILTLKA